ncbi:hypothetical protein FIV04_03350 [Vibrio sp. THAF190c]|nr:hypothetical protein FIV04_03350 [Vibrio sp. THAF190c]
MMNAIKLTFATQAAHHTNSKWRDSKIKTQHMEIQHGLLFTSLWYGNQKPLQ